MGNKCPKCGSVRIIKANEDVNICLACESLLNDKGNPTRFHHLTQSLEEVARAIVYKTLCWGLDRRLHTCWKSPIIYDVDFYVMDEAIAATIEKLKEIYNE